MNIILKIILFNLLLIYSLKYNNKLLCLLIILFSLYMLYTYYYINNVIEGNTSLDEYKMNFAGLLNKNIKTSYKEDLLYDRILDNFTKLLKLMDKTEGRVPSTQMCRGELGEWSECSRECGRGQMSRRFNVTREAGEDGIKCIYEDGQQETKECFKKLCEYHEPCVEDFDCLSNYCSKQDKICTYPHMCERDQLQNCNFEQCQELEDKYGDYTYDTGQQRCINKFVDVNVKELTEKEEISLEQSQLEKDSKKNEQKSKATILNKNKEHLCYLVSDRVPGSSSGPCKDVPEPKDIKCNKRAEDNIPCYYDYSSNVCKKISQNPDYLGDKWVDIKRGLNQIKEGVPPNISTAADFFRCNSQLY